jgi:hypothetical protein
MDWVGGAGQVFRADYKRAHPGRHIFLLATSLIARQFKPTLRHVVAWAT